MALKNKIPDSQFDQLLVAYEQTYGHDFAQQQMTART